MLIQGVFVMKNGKLQKTIQQKGDITTILEQLYKDMQPNV
jgi:hypothetical protein